MGERQTEDLKVPGSIRVAAYASALSSVVLEKAIHDRPRNSRKISTVPTRRRLCYDGRVVKAFDLKSKGISSVGSSPTRSVRALHNQLWNKSKELHSVLGR